MDQASVLHHIPNRRVSYNATRGKYALDNVPRVFWQPAGIKRGSHKAVITCYQTDRLYCKVQLFPSDCDGPVFPNNLTVLHSFEGAVSVTGSNAFVKIHPAIVEAMTIRKGTHCIDWTCMRTRNVFGIIRLKSPHNTSF